MADDESGGDQLSASHRVLGRPRGSCSKVLGVSHHRGGDSTLIHQFRKDGNRSLVIDSKTALELMLHTLGTSVDLRSHAMWVCTNVHDTEGCMFLDMEIEGSNLRACMW